jgi:tetraacyldisaccharide 4'-kinase
MSLAERYVLDLVDGKRRAPLLSPLLHVSSFLYASGVALRHGAYRLKILPTRRVPSLVISIGNIACGGTGKTPFVRRLAQELAVTRKVAILSRGYRSSFEHCASSVLISGENRPLFPAALCGDEPYLLASSLPQVDVWVGKHRVGAARLAAEQGAEVVILDDGMQYRKLERDCEIVILDGEDLFAGGRFIPAGRLREFPYRLKGADLVVINHARADIPLAHYQEKLRVFTDAPLITVRTRSSVQKGSSIANRRVGVFCALGRPQRFFRSVQEFPAEIVATLTTSDHTRFSDEELRRFATQCREKKAEALVCTAKDAVKLDSLHFLDLPLVVLDAEMDILEGDAAWQNLLNRLQHAQPKGDAPR